MTVTHRCGPEKLDGIVRKGIPTLELDLSTAYRRKCRGWTIEQLTNLLVHDPGIRRWLHLPERAMVRAQQAGVPQPQTPTKTPAPISRAPSSSIYAPFEGTLLVFDSWYGLVPRDPCARAQLIEELNIRRTREK